MFLVSFLRDQATTHLWRALVLDRRGVRHEHRSDQTPKFGDRWERAVAGGSREQRNQCRGPCVCGKDAVYGRL